MRIEHGAVWAVGDGSCTGEGDCIRTGPGTTDGGGDGGDGLANFDSGGPSGSQDGTGDPQDMLLDFVEHDENWFDQNLVLKAMA